MTEPAEPSGPSTWVVTVDNPRRLRQGGTVEPGDLPGLGLLTSWWCQTPPGAARFALDPGRALTDAEVETVRLVAESVDDAEVGLRRAAREAFVANRGFLALTSPTAAQVRAQVQALTRQVNGLARLLLTDYANEPEA